MQVDYSFSQRALHHIVLSSKYLKRIFFDLEASLYRNDITNIDILNPYRKIKKTEKSFPTMLLNI